MCEHALAALYEQAAASGYAELPRVDRLDERDFVCLFDADFVTETLRHDDDLAIPGRHKALHRQGAVARVRLGGTPALLRLSAIRTMLPPLGRYTLGAAIKASRNGRLEDALLMTDFVGVDAPDMLCHAMSNAPQKAVLPPGRLDPFGPAFEVAEAAIQAVNASPGVSAIRLPARHVFDGGPRTLDVVRAWPCSSGRSAWAATPAALDFRARLAKIPVGTCLFEVQLGDDPERVPIALDAPFVASAFGDRQLHFRHATSLGR